MKWVKLFEGFNTDKKVELTNQLVIKWAILNYLIKKKVKLEFHPRSYDYCYKFLKPSGMMLFYLNKEGTRSICCLSDEEYLYIFEKVLRLEWSLHHGNEFNQLFDKVESKALIKYLKYKDIKFA
jgi:hypothetical protein